jgi:hypothetical protein
VDQPYQLLDTALDTSGLPQGEPMEGRPEDLPLDKADPRIRAYFAEIGRRVEAVWTYPQEAVQQKQSGSGVIAFMLKRDGRVGEVH